MSSNARTQRRARTSLLVRARPLQRVVTQSSSEVKVTRVVHREAAVAQGLTQLAPFHVAAKTPGRAGLTPEAELCPSRDAQSVKSAGGRTEVLDLSQLQP